METETETETSNHQYYSLPTSSTHRHHHHHHHHQYYSGRLLLVVILYLASASEDLIISRFQQYLQINTAHPNPKYYEAADFILSEAKSLSLESQVLELVKGKPLVLLKWPGKNPKLPSILLNSHTDVVPAEHHKWSHPPFDADQDQGGRIYARGSQDMKCVGLQYLEAIRKLKSSGFQPLRTLYLSFVPDEEIGGHDGAAKLADSETFQKMNVGIVLDEGLASPDQNYRVFFGERCPWWLVIKATGAPGHGAKLYDNTAMENLLKSIESVRRFRAAQFDLVKAGFKPEGEVISVNMVFLKAGTPSPTGFVMNLQPSEAEAGFDIRVPPTADPASLERRIAEEWAPASRNMTFELGQFKHKVSVYDKFGKPILTAADSSNPWWALLEGAVKKANGKLGKPEIFPASTDARYFRERGLPAIGFSPMANTPILLHDHNEFLSKDEYLKAGNGKILVWTDNQALTKFRTSMKLKSRQIRWSQTLEEFNFEIRHRPGNQMQMDHMTRRCQDGEPGDGTADRILLPDRNWPDANSVRKDVKLTPSVC